MTNKSIDIDQPVQYIKGVGPKKAERFEKLGVKTVGDLLFHLPLRYEDRSKFKTIAELEVGEVAVVKAKVKSARAMFRGRGRRMFEVAFADSTGILRANWFSFSSKALTTRFAEGTEWIVSGKVSFNRFRGSKTITHPDTEAVSPDGEGEGESLNFGHITPIYPLTEGLSQKSVRSAAHAALRYLDHLADFVPESLNRRYKLPSLAQSVKRTHWPEEDADIEAFAEFKTREQKKLIFNEFFLIQAGLALKRNKAKQTYPGSGMSVNESLISKIKKLLPFTLTNAQERVLKEISADMGADSPMSRLLQGDVGSGKTVIALSAALIAVHNKKQAAIMAPTEILATQHYRNIMSLLQDTGVNVALLTSGSPAKKQAYESIQSGKTHIVVGTHAIIQDAVGFKDLGLAIIDEQHRFGVTQRASLIGKGSRPHTLIMTATPIPRTLAMTLYGDLDVSVIDELPPGRGSIVTRIHQPSNRLSAIQVVRDQVSAGRQAFIVYPLVDESEKLQLKAATAMFEQFKKGEFEGLKLGLTHGRMKSAEKEEAMERFTRKQIDILISTTVIEVGIDQPNATVMMIEHADRFGLSQLHQLRGRVGRSVHRSYCLLMAGAGPGTPAWDRLRIMEKSQDGFKIAEADLQLRGSGDFFGVKQSGLPELKIGNILRDHKILSEARKAAFTLIEKDPGLSKPEHAELRRALTERWRDRFELGEIG
ncbi:ATP-dependent DNA helicase RecG [hydrothermal vent metagenome]|uniref:ATP-dependent DNA helicase RecG n=1 Tax=hydrothermal vent metagenome TaxID=652676 RepID=A0A3B1CE97_9ZZZZ